MEDATNLSNTILLTIAVSWKIGKVEKEKALNHHKQGSNKKSCAWKFACAGKSAELIITHTALAHSEPSQKSKMEPFVNMAEF